MLPCFRLKLPYSFSRRFELMSGCGKRVIKVGLMVYGVYQLVAEIRNFAAQVRVVR